MKTYLRILGIVITAFSLAIGICYCVNLVFGSAEFVMGQAAIILGGIFSLIGVFFDFDPELGYYDEDEEE